MEKTLQTLSGKINEEIGSWMQDHNSKAIVNMHIEILPFKGCLHGFWSIQYRAETFEGDTIIQDFSGCTKQKIEEVTNGSNS